MSFQRLIALLKKEYFIDLRNAYGLASIVLYIVASAFILALITSTVTDQLWVIFYWIVVVFTSMNVVLKSFMMEDKSRNLYYYTTLDPYTFIFGKLIYNFLFTGLICLLVYLVFTLFFGIPTFKASTFLTTLLTCMGISSSLTFAGAIASKTKNSNTMIAVLGLPVIIPTLLLGISNHIGLLLDSPLKINQLPSLAGVVLLIWALLIWLFPYLWRS